MNQLQLSFLGPFGVLHNRAAITTFDSNKVRALLVYLAIEGGMHSRSALATLLWPEHDEANARTNLRQVLYQLRRAIGDETADPPFLLITRQTIGLNPAAECITDVVAFRHHIAAATDHAHAQLAACPPCLEHLRQAVALYHNDFLTGFVLDDSDAFEEWRRIIQEQLHLQALEILQRLIDVALVHHDDNAILRYAQRQLTLEPWYEAAHCQIMRVLARNGQRAAALAQYQRCRQILLEEVHVEPDATTTALYLAIRADQTGAGSTQAAPLLTPVPPTEITAPAPLALDEITRPTPYTLRTRSTNEIRQPTPTATNEPQTIGPPFLQPPVYDWGEMPVGTHFFGRAADLAQLQTWLLTQGDGPLPASRSGARVIAVLGTGGTGKTALVAQVVQQVAAQFTTVIWRSLLNAPPIEEILHSWLQTLARQPLIELPTTLDAQFQLLLTHLGEQRCLLILDNAESILCAGNAGGTVGNVRPGYEGYIQLLTQLSLREHQSCLLLTSREQPQVLSQLARQTTKVYLQQLMGLDQAAGQALLQQHGLRAGMAATTTLIERYSGNPLALQIVADTINDLFGGNLAAFQEDMATVFGDIRSVLDQQFARLSALEQELLIWLAIEREPVTPARLRTNLVAPVSAGAVIETLRGLQRRSLLVSSEAGITLQNVIIEYLTDRVIDTVGQELLLDQWPIDRSGLTEAVGESGALPVTVPVTGIWLNHYALVKAEAKEYVRQSQARLLLAPIAANLVARLGKPAVVALLGKQVQQLQRTAQQLPGYAAGNLCNLLLHLGVALDGYDFSRLCLWQVDFRNLAINNINLTDTDLAHSRFAEAFGFLYTIALTPDGTTIAAATGDGDIRLWRVADSALLSVLHGHQGMTRAIALTPDGETLVSGGDDGLVHIWQIAQGHLLRTLTGHTSHVLGVAVSPDGGTVAGVGADQTIRLWSLRTGEQTRLLSGHAGWVRTVAFHPDGEILATGSYDETIRLWDLQSGKLRQILKGHAGFVIGVAFHPAGQLLASASTDGTIRLWDHQAGVSHVLQSHGGGFWSTAFSPDGTLLAGGSNNQLYLWHIDHPEWPPEPPAIAQVLIGHTNAIHGITFTPDSQVVLTGSGDQTLRLWERGTGQVRQILQGHTQALQSLCFHPSGQMLAASGTDHLIRLWDLATGQVQHTLRGHSQSIEMIGISPDGAHLVSGSSDGTVLLWQLPPSATATIPPPRLLLDDGADIATVAFSPTGEQVAAATKRRVRLLDVASGTLVQTLAGDSEVYALAFHPDGQTLATGHGDNRIRIWDLRQGTVRATLTGHTSLIWSLAYSPNGQWLASGSFDYTIRLWQVPPDSPVTHHATLQGHTGRVFSVAFDGESRTLVSGGSDRTMRVWSVAKGQIRHVCQGHGHWIWSVGVSPDGRTFASGSIDETIRLWDVESGDCVGVLRAPGPYAGMRIGGVTGISAAQKAALVALGAVEG